MVGAFHGGAAPRPRARKLKKQTGDRPDDIRIVRVDGEEGGPEASGVEER